MTKKTCFLIAFFISTLFLFFSCRTISEREESLLPPEELDSNWKKNGEGIELLDYFDSKIEYHVVKIDLSKKWEIISFPENDSWNNPKSVKEFAKKNNLEVCVNTNPFERKINQNPFSKTQPIGIIISNSKLISRPNSRYSAIAFYKQGDGTYKAEIFDSQTEIPSTNPDFSFGGFFTILRDNKIYEFKNFKDVRCAAAISDDGRTLYLLAGKNLSYKDTALIFMNLGAETALQFDGGSSTSLVFKNKNLLNGFIRCKVAAGFGLSYFYQ